MRGDNPGAGGMTATREVTGRNSRQVGANRQAPGRGRLADWAALVVRSGSAGEVQSQRRDGRQAVRTGRDRDPDALAETVEVRRYR